MVFEILDKNKSIIHKLNQSKIEKLMNHRSITNNLDEFYDQHK